MNDVVKFVCLFVLKVLVCCDVPGPHQEVVRCATACTPAGPDIASRIAKAAEYPCVIFSSQHCII